mmetsp:Transcript_30676/g.94873  ORF Transcript_30676/g.94873 Transcript_30676/m.94873 type:complete len:232 (+) Transcript_30676:4204-4899(+)
MLGHRAAVTIVLAALEHADSLPVEKFVSGAIITDTRVAAAYAQLATLENSYRIVLKREQRRQCESLHLLPSHRHDFKRACPDAQCDNLPRASEKTLGLRCTPLTLSSWEFKNERADPIFFCKPAQLSKQVKARSVATISSTLAMCLLNHSRARRALKDLHQSLLIERSSRRRIGAAALSAGVRAANTAKQQAKAAQTNALCERRLAQRDALREARESAACETYKFSWRICF